MDFRDFIKKIQSQPEDKKKRILWAIVIAVGIILVIFWVAVSYKKISEFNKEGFINNFNITDN